MRRKTYLATSLLILTWSVMPILGLQSSSQKISSHGVIRYGGKLSWLYADGTFIKDEYGRIVVLLGLGIDYVMIDNRGTTLEYVLNIMKQYRMNCLRLGFNILDIYVNEPWFTQLDYAKMDSVLRTLEENNIYAILDAHHNSDVFIEQKQNWIGKWVEIAQHYKDWSVIAGYELLNEPSGPNATYEITRQNYLDCVDAIRTIDTKHILILGSTSSDTIDQMERVWRPEDIRPNTIYSGHEWTYPRSLLKERDYTTVNSYLKKRIFDPIEPWYQTRNATILISEFGIVYWEDPTFWNDPANHAETYKNRKLINYLDAKGIGYMYGTYGIGVKNLVESGLMNVLFGQ